MHRKSFTHHPIRRLLAFAPLAGALLLLAAIPSAATATFEPGFSAALDDATPDTSSDIHFELSLESGDLGPATVVAFLPADWGIAAGADLPLGAEVGMVHADISLGIIGSPCNQLLPSAFTLLNASLDNTDPIDFNDKDGGDPFIQDWAEDLDNSDLIDGIEHWPDFIDRVLPHTEDAPSRRLAGWAIVASVPVLMQFIVFPPGAVISTDLPDDPALGYPAVALLQDYGDNQTIPQPGPITDLCTPLSADLDIFGVTRDNPDTQANEGGFESFTNPSAGTYAFAIATLSLRDADGDGIENDLDTCPLDPNHGDPRIANSGDSDSDGLDAACDPNDDAAKGGTNSDEDGDGYLNRQDNCPLEPNGEDADNQADADVDGIGDACDPNPDFADSEGTSTLACVEILVEVGGGGASVAGDDDICPGPVSVAEDAKGNVDCDNDIDTVDALGVLRHSAGLPVLQTDVCPAIGSGQPVFADINCDGAIGPIDALLILRFVAGLPVALPQGCPLIGSVGA